jgi:ABC-2 type transport system permease protein
MCNIIGLQNIIADMFETITMFDLRTTEAKLSAKSNDNYRIQLTMDSFKARADSLGNEKKIPIHDWIDIGVYGAGGKGKDSLLYCQKHLFDKDRTTITIETKIKPIKAGIDPLHKLIDRNTTDNVKKVDEGA